MEPPFHHFVRKALKIAGVSPSTRSLWDISERPPYLLGLVFAARQALREGTDAISVVEFGVAGGNGLVVLEREAAAVSREFGVAISVFGFDRGNGLPEFIGDHRDHPDLWRPGDFPMDEAALRSRLLPTTRLFLGDVAETVPQFLEDRSIPPLGFISFDLDLYSSTSRALKILSAPEARILQCVALTFDDVDHARSHRFAGELLAIDEFNMNCPRVKIDLWRGLAQDRPFPVASYLRKMYMAHNLDSLAQTRLVREPVKLILQPTI